MFDFKKDKDETVKKTDIFIEIACFNSRQKIEKYTIEKRRR